MKTYIWAVDAGHAWLAVKRKELDELNIADKISSYSYVKGGTVYLEEDCDARHFFEAYESKHGVKPNTKEGKHWDVQPCRSFARYSSQAASVVEPALAEPGDTLVKFIDDNNRWIALFNKTGMKFPLTQSDADDLGRTLDSQLSPENLHCDGEISNAEAMRKYNFLSTVCDELNIYCDANGLTRPKIYEL
jgi:hypothetical protein